jgi:hypothetical protein
MFYMKCEEGERKELRRERLWKIFEVGERARFCRNRARIDVEWYTFSLAGRTSSISNFCFDFFVPDYHYEYLPQAGFQK